MIIFTVYGTPVPQGSTKAFIPRGWNRAVITTDNSKLKPWRQQVTETALSMNAQMITGAVAIGLHFYFRKPKSASKRLYPTVKPDTDKLIRGILDALTGVCYRDDAQVVRVDAAKHYGDVERCEIRVEAI